MSNIEIKIPLEELKKRSLFVAVPMYGGQCHGLFARSISDLTAFCAHHGIVVRLYFLFNESLIPRARNYCTDEFLRSGLTHMMFIDADIGFDARDVIAMMALQDPDPTKDQYDILAGPYPKKTIAFEKIVQAVNKGFADENPNDLEKFVGDYVFNPVSGTGEIPIHQPAEVLEAGTGFMMIRRNTFEKFAAAYPQQHYKPDHVRTEHFDGSREIVAFFDCPIDHKRTNIEKELEAFLVKNPKATKEDIQNFVADPNKSSLGIDYSKRYLSEDYMFAQWSRKIGLKTFLCPWMKLQHVGSYVFGGSLQDLAALGASPTADPSQIKKKKK